jgi:hypothetical protein
MPQYSFYPASQRQHVDLNLFHIGGSNMLMRHRLKFAAVSGWVTRQCCAARLWRSNRDGSNEPSQSSIKQSPTVSEAIAPSERVF